MKVTLTFNLPQDSQEHQDAMEGSTLRRVIEEYDNKLRNMVKYENKNYIRVDNARKLLLDLMREYEL